MTPFRLAALLDYAHGAWLRVRGDRVPTSMWIALRPSTTVRDVRTYLGGPVLRAWFMDLDTPPGERPVAACEQFLDGGLGPGVPVFAPGLVELAELRADQLYAGFLWGALSGVGRRLEVEGDRACERAVLWAM